jgi:hypothetical protein
MRVLLDENIDRLLKALFAPEFDVMTVGERGWEGKANGDLLTPRVNERLHSIQPGEVVHVPF